MSTGAVIPSLFLFTLIAVLAIAVIGYLLFIRKRSNRHPKEPPELAGQTMVSNKGDET